MAESGEEWELSKENIRPIQQGRKQKVLKVALAPHPEEIISQQRQSFENELRTYSGNDPLFVWCKYIKWVEQNFPKGGKEGHIKQLMERCLSILKDEQKYFDDDRFIDIMLKYAGLSGKPLEVYNYMYSNNIGCKSAKFFINWSWELEQIGNLKKADEVLTEGMQRKAQPFEKMKSYLADFEIRLATKIKASVETNNHEPENNRSAFAVLKPQKKNMAPILRTGEAVIEKPSSLILNRHQPQPRSIKQSTKVPFKIYDSENINPSLPIQTQTGARNCLNPENYKENERKASKWNKVKMKSHGVIHETNPDFKFHCDEEKDDKFHTPRSVPKTSNILSSRRRTPSPPIALFEPPDPMKRPMYPKNKVYGGAEEYSLEEIRAVAWLENKKKAEKEKLLAEQQKKIEEQAKKEEELRKQVEYLAKKIEVLQNHVSSSGAKPFDLLSVNNLKKSLPENAENKFFPQTLQSNSNVELYSHNSVTEKSVDISVYNSADKMIQELYNKSLSLPTDDAGNQVVDFSKEFSGKCSIFTSTKNTFDKLPKTNEDNNVIKQSSDKLFFSFYHDPTTKVIPDLDYTSSKEASNVSVTKDLGKLPSASQDLDKKSCSSFNDQTDVSQKSVHQTEKMQNLSEKNDCKLPFTFYTDPTENIPSEADNAVSSTKVLKQGESNVREACQINENCVASKVSDLPFSFYHDPTNAIPDVAVNAAEKDDCKELPHQELSDEDSENIPPKGYIQDKTKRELAGILEPSKNILYIPLEEQELDEDEDNESDFEGYIYQDERRCADETLIPPSNTEQFSTAKFLASTPCVSKPKKGPSLEKSNQASSKQITQQDFSNLPDRKDIPNDENATIKLEPKTHKELTLNSDLKTTCNSRLSKMLSVIMETSENSTKSSSSSSSASLTKSNHLDTNSAHFINVHKHHSRLETREPSIICSASENLRPNSNVKDELNKENSVKKSDIYLVDLDPFDPKIIERLLKSINLDCYENICNFNKSVRTIKINENMQIGNETYFIENLIAEGAYAKVYKAIKPFDICDSHSNKPLALKVCKKANEWEFYICSEIQKRLLTKTLLPDIKNSVTNIIIAIKYIDGIVLVSEYDSFGTLLDVINFYKKQCSPIPELLTVFFTLQMLHIVSKLHECNIIHGDIKPDNFLLTSTFPGEDVLDNISKSTSCLRLIDFGRAIDLSLFDKGICFTSTFSTSDFKCNEMKEQKPWVFQLDWYGVLSCIHALLFQEYMKVTKTDGTWRIEKKFKRYWFNSLWEPLFNKLLNIPECYEEPDVDFFINMIESKLRQSASQFIGQLSRFSDVYSKRK